MPQDNTSWAALLIQSIAHAIETIFRYFLPGGILLCLLYFSVAPNPPPPWVGQLWQALEYAHGVFSSATIAIIFLILILCAGMTCYALHKILWDALDCFLIGPFVYCDYPTDIYSTSNCLFCRTIRNIWRCIAYANRNSRVDCTVWASLTVHSKIGRSKDFKSYRKYKWAVLHHALLFCEMVFLFSCFAEKGSFLNHHFLPFIILIVFLSFIAILVYCWMSRIQWHWYADPELRKALIQNKQEEDNNSAAVKGLSAR